MNGQVLGATALVIAVIASLVALGDVTDPAAEVSGPMVQGARDKLFVRLGSFTIDEGLSHEVQPLVHSCVDVCRERYPGHENYACSTREDVLNHRGFVSCFGAFGCFDYSETFREGDTYTYGACTALVQDGCSTRNFCWGSVDGSATATPTSSRLPSRAVVIGEYLLGNMEPYQGFPATKSCVQVCTAMFPGYKKYACSISRDVLTYDAHVTCRGKSGCRFVADTFTLGATYISGACAANVADNCGASNYCWADPEGAEPVHLDSQGRVHVGSYNLSDTPSQDERGLVRSCVEACEILFPGHTSYACSTMPYTLNFRAYVTCHQLSGCTQHEDTFTRGNAYSEGACSAYASDNCKQVNHCWADVCDRALFGGIVDDDDNDDDEENDEN